jgi:hypothetical protein
MFLMKKDSVILIVLACFALQAMADDDLWPTNIYTGDCVSARISAKLSPREVKIDRLHCLEVNSDKADKIERCTDRYSHGTVEFFTDRCGSNDDPYYIGLNGQTHVLRRIAGNADKPPYLTGKFLGDDMVVEVKSLRLLKKTYDPQSSHAEEDVDNAEYQVKVLIRRKGRIAKIINGILSYGR